MKPEKKSPKKTVTKKAATASTAKPAKKPAKIPPILLEGDESPVVRPSGPGKRYAEVPKEAAKPTASPKPAELPEAYGTKKLFLTARDPRWLYASWDLTREQLAGYNVQARDKHLILRVFKQGTRPVALAEIHLHPESKNWFVPVEEAGTRYVTELGYYSDKNKWVSIATSSATLTPPENLSEDLSVRYATIPIEVPFEQLIQIVKEAARENKPLAEAIVELREQGNKKLPAPKQIASAVWTPAQEKALSSLVTIDAVRRVWMGSLEITEVIRRQLVQQISSISASEFGLTTSPGAAISSISSFSGPGERPRSFWFNINAELIIYGATEPDAKVTIGGKEIRLRGDGSFSFRFILPDGHFELPARAVSSDGVDARSADLSFERKTKYNGEVGAHPQDSALKPPLAANVS